MFNYEVENMSIVCHIMKYSGMIEVK